MRRLLTVGLLLWAATAAAQTTTTFTDRLVLADPPAKSSETACLWRDASTGMVAAGACPTGTVTSVGLSLPGIFSVSGSPVTTSGTLTASLVSQTQNLVWASPNGSSGAPTFRALADADVPDNLTLGTVSGTPTFSGAVTFSGNIGSHVLPATTDTYDLGSASRLWNQAFISQLNALVFAEATATLFGGYSIVGYNAGALAADVASGATSVDFGKSMTPGHWVLIRAHDTSGTVKAEYLLVGSNVSGTTYNVTRDLAAAHGTDPAWASGTPFLVLGASGTGRIELRAYSTPQISVLTQGATYGAVNEKVRIGALDGMPGMSAGKYGLYIGDLTANQGLSYYDGTLTLRGTLNADDIVAGTLTGRTVRTAASGARVVLDTTPALTWYDASARLGQLDATGVVLGPDTGAYASYSDKYAYRFAVGGSSAGPVFGLYGRYVAGALKELSLISDWDGTSDYDSGAGVVRLEATSRTHPGSGVYTASIQVGTPFGGTAPIVYTAPGGHYFSGSIETDGAVTTGGLLTAPQVLVAGSGVNPGSILKATATSGSNTTRHNLLRLEAGDDATLGPLYFIAGLYPSATGSARYVQLFAGDTAAYRPVSVYYRLGVNTTAPGYTLDVDGDANATGYRAGGTAGISATFNPTSCTSMTFKGGILTAKAGC